MADEHAHRPPKEREGHCPECGNRPPLSLVCGDCDEFVNGVAFNA